MDLADLRFEDVGPHLVARIAGEVDMSNSDDLRSAIERELGNHAAGVVLDFSRTSYLDSAGIHLLYHLKRRLDSRGQRLAIVIEPGSPPFDALHYSGVLGEIDNDSTLERALVGLA